MFTVFDGGTERKIRAVRAKRAGVAYQGAFEAVFAILIGAGLGVWADSHFETRPIFLLVGFAVGFAAFVLRLVRLARQMQASAADETNLANEGTREG